MIEPPPTTAASALWIGWRRPSHATRRVWVRLAKGPTEAECFRRLLEADRANPMDHCGLLVLAEGVKPGDQ